MSKHNWRRKLEEGVIKRLQQVLPYQELFCVEILAGSQSDKLEVRIYYLDDVQNISAPNKPFTLREADRVASVEEERYLEDLEGGQMREWVHVLKKQVVDQLIEDHDLPSIDEID